MALCQRNLLIFLILILLGLVFSPFSFNDADIRAQEESKIPTSILITVCGDGIVDEYEFCDSGENNGDYGPSIASRYCNDDCTAWGPYCGDGILQQEHNEECDDGNNSSQDGCSPSCKIEQGGGQPGGGGAYPGGTPIPPIGTGVVVKGKAYPFSEVHILRDGEVIGLAQANSLADFTFTMADMTPGVTTFGFWAEDTDGIRSIFLTITFQVVPNAITTVSGVFLPPTIKSDVTSVKRGDIITISGQTVPETDVYIYINSPEEIIKESQSNRGGVWDLPFNTTPLSDNTFHTAKALFQTESLGALVKSGFGRFINFYVGEGIPEEMLCPGADLNKDGRVNLLDFSILLYYWGSDNPCADQNQDGIVNLADFSIMMYYWTG
jgi:cysteine-rich repeat protein